MYYSKLVSEEQTSKHEIYVELFLKNIAKYSNFISQTELNFTSNPIILARHYNLHNIDKIKLTMSWLNIFCGNSTQECFQ